MAAIILSGVLFVPALLGLGLAMFGAERERI